MSTARIAVLFLRLASLGGILFSGILVACPFLFPEEIPSNAAEAFSPGCFSACFLVTLIPLSLVPAAIAWVIQEKVVQPQEAVGESWREGALSREERLGVWICYFANLRVRHRLLRNTDDDPLPLVLQTEIPRALRELDRGRQDRLLRFLRGTGLEDGWEGGSLSTAYGILAAGPNAKLPRRGLVAMAAGGFALLSGFFLFWAGLALFTLIFDNPLQAVGMSDGRPAELIIVLSALCTPALVCGLAAAGLRRLYRQAVRSLEEVRGDSESIRRIALKSVQDQVDDLMRCENGGDAEGEPLVRQIIYAMVTITAPELDGSYRAKLVRLLYESGWLIGKRALSMDGFDLKAAELAGVSLPNVCLSGADLSGADLSNADLAGADLRRCALRGSDLRSARLLGADLRGADLRYSRLQKADLERADLSAVLLEGANFWGAALAGAELSGTQGQAEFLAPLVDAV